MKVGVIGAGTMGSGIAQAFAQTEGYEVCLCDINEEFAANGKAKIAKGFEKRVAKGKMEQADADAILAKITTWKLKNRHSKNYRISVKKMQSLQQTHLHYQSQKLVQDLIVQ